MMDSWATPKWIMRQYEEWFDPCPLNPNWETGVDGLDLEWKDKTFVNPPYSKPMPWIEKAIEEARKGKRIVMLLNVDTSTKWYSKLNEYGAHFLYFAERLHFSEGGANPKPSMLVIL